jgi:hypothetical protein
MRAVWLILPLALAAVTAGPGAAQPDEGADAGWSHPIPVPLAPRSGGDTISVTVDPGIRSMAQVDDLRLRLLRARMHQGFDLPIEALRQLAALGDGLAAQRLVRRWQDDPARRPSQSDVALHAAIAVGSGRIATLPDMIAAMHRLDPETEPAERVRRYMGVLYPHAWAGNRRALDAVMTFNGAGRLFGPLSETTRARLVRAVAEIDDPAVGLRLALMLLRESHRTGGLSDSVAADLERLLRHLQGSSHPGAAAAAQTLRGLSAGREVAAR